LKKDFFYKDIKNGAFEAANGWISNIHYGLRGDRETEYIKKLYARYLSYIHDSLSRKLQPCNALEENRTAYVLSIEKLLLDTCIGTKQDLRDMFLSSIKQHQPSQHKNDEDLICQILLRGEHKLDSIQQKLDLSLHLKSYYLQAQLHKDYIQLTLYQVIKTSFSKKNGTSTITIKDLIISIDDIFMAICDKMWAHIQSAGEGFVNFCDKHCAKQNEFLEELQLLEVYNEFVNKFNLYILSENVSITSS
jgi:hypothetical protein